MHERADATVKTLNPATLPLAGRHLIEASAGTGKTYNITRLYLRLLLEKKLRVQQILVMTFTTAATEELRGRIDKELRHALANWGELGKEEPFYKEIEQQYNKQTAEQVLKAALLELDEAAIYTIHGFCKRALTTQAFASGIPLEISMQADTSELLLESVRDWLRQISQDKTDFDRLSEKNWHIPEEFFKAFKSALTTSKSIQASDAEQLRQEFVDSFKQRKQQVMTELLEHQALIFSALVEGKKDEAIRRNEWQELIDWLQQENDTPCPKAAGNFINGNRYKNNGEIKALLQPFKDLRKTHTDKLSHYLQRVEDTPVYQLVAQGLMQIRQSFNQLKQRQALMDFDDLITSLSQRVQADDGQELVEGLRQQYPAALVDEFQDTDPEQYAILDQLYPAEDTSHVLRMIGDPKQAIYGFRGGDIFTYLEAREGAEHQWHMDTNWRSVCDVVKGYNRLFWGRPLTETESADVFGYEIAYEPIQPAPRAKAAQHPLSDDPLAGLAAINYFWLPEIVDPSGNKGAATTRDWQLGLARWCVAEIGRLLTSVRLGDEPLTEKDIAILIRRGQEAQLMRDELALAGFASVYLSDKENIYASEQAQELLMVLTGVLDCENDSLLTAALSTRLMGGDSEQLAAFREPAHAQEWDEQRNRAVGLRRLWQERGCMAMLLQLIRHSFRPDPSQHERALTNMLHLAELLQQASRQYKHPQQLLKWFHEQCFNQTQQEEAQLRLESDANLIRIVTQHGSKGLEYPIVFIPFASQYRDPVRFGSKLIDYFEYHDPLTRAAKYQIGQSDNAIRWATQEGHAESIRLLYVAITRATHRCYVGVAPFKSSHLSPLGLALRLATADLWDETLLQLVVTADNSSTVKTITSDTPSWPCQQQTEGAEKLQAAVFEQKIDDSWSLSSFSALIRNVHVARQEQKERDDEAYDQLFLAERETTHAQNQSTTNPENLPLRFRLRKGADAGNLLHDILEHTDFSQPNKVWIMDAPLRRFGGMTETEQHELQAWLQACLNTPLPSMIPSIAELQLADISWSQTLREIEFYFPMTEVKLQALARCLQQHRGSSEAVGLPGAEFLQGMMHGFIDLIFEHQDRYYVADYKSTHLGDQLEDYHFQALLHNNQSHFYDLQYLIYSLALHRYLAVRLADYDPEKHFGGVYYLYLRGMSPAQENPYGVFYTAIETAQLIELDRIFKGEEAEENAA